MNRAFPRPSEITAVVFDFDGTLASSPLDFAYMHRRAREALSEYADLPEELGGPILEDIERVCARLSPADARAARSAAMAAIEQVEVEAARQGTLFPFVRPMLHSLRKSRVKTAVITRNCRAAIMTVFPDMNGYMDCVLTREDVGKVKPDPEHLLAALERLNCTPGESLMVGDHPMDIQVGKRAGTLTAGVESGDAAAERLIREEPDFMASDAGALLRSLF